MAGTKQTSGGSKVPPRPGTGRGDATRSGAARGRSSAQPRAGAKPAAGAGRPGGRPAPRASARQVAQRRRQRNIYMAAGGSGLVVLVVVVILAISLAGGGKGPSVVNGEVKGTFALPASLVSQVEDVPVAKLAAAAQACASSTKCFSSATGASPPQKLPASNPVLRSGGKPEILYVGAEYCPYCAAERWALLMALSKFGTFGPLRGTTSSATDVNPSTPTFSFYKAVYNSKYLSFVPVEEETNTQATLQVPTNAQQSIVLKYDTTPYVPAADVSQGSNPIPFVYLAGRYVVTSNQYDASPISGMQIDTAVPYMTSGTNATSKGALASAGYLVGDLCAITNGRPGAVCSHLPAKLRGITTTSANGQSSSLTTPTTAKAKPTSTTAKKAG